MLGAVRGTALDSLTTAIQNNLNKMRKWQVFQGGKRVKPTREIMSSEWMLRPQGGHTHENVENRARRGG